MVRTCHFPQYHFSRGRAGSRAKKVEAQVKVEISGVRSLLNLDLSLTRSFIGRGREPQLRVSQSRGSRGVDAQATRRQHQGRVRLGLLQNHVAIGFSGVILASESSRMKPND